MTVRKTSTKQVVIGRPKSGQFVQVGSNPPGTTSGTARLPLHTSDFSTDAPSSAGGATPMLQGLTMSYIDENYMVEIQGSLFYEALKIKPSDPVYLKRGNIVRNLIVKRAWVLDEGLPTERTSLQLGRYFVETPVDLTDFLGASGYPYPSEESRIFTGYLEAKKPDSMLNAVEFRNISTSQDEFTTYVNWKVNPEAASARVRWRTTPRFTTERSILTYSLLSGGNYTQKPSIKITSDSGRGAAIDISCGLTSVSLGSGGSGYVSPVAIVSGGGGTGAAVFLGLSLGVIVSALVVSGGTGYTSLPEIVISDVSGTGASVTALALDIASIWTTQEGGGYTRTPDVVIDETYGSGGSIIADLEYVLSGAVDSIRVLDGGTGYTSSEIIITGGGGTGASAYAVVEKGVITEVRVTQGGEDYTSFPTVLAVGGSGNAVLQSNVDYISGWNYMDVDPTKNFQLDHLKRNVQYEVQFLLSRDLRFRGNVEYTSSYTLIYDA